MVYKPTNISGGPYPVPKKYSKWRPMIPPSHGCELIGTPPDCAGAAGGVSLQRRQVMSMMGKTIGKTMENGWKNHGKWMENGWTMMENAWWYMFKSPFGTRGTPLWSDPKNNPVPLWSSIDEVPCSLQLHRPAIQCDHWLPKELELLHLGEPMTVAQDARKNSMNSKSEMR